MEGTEEVSSVVAQWPILAIFLGGVAAAFGGMKFFWPKQEKHDGNGHADLRAFIGSGFEDVKERVAEVRSDLKEHNQQDADRFEDIGERIARLEAQQGQWTGEERRGTPRERPEDRQWRQRG